MVFRGLDLWRNHPAVRSQYRHALLGLRPALAIFGVFLFADAAASFVRGGDDDQHGYGSAEGGEHAHE